MECELFRQRMLEDPARRGAELEQHEKACAACAAFAARVRQTERLIHEAVRFDVQRVRDAGTTQAITRRDPRMMIAGLAAVFVAAVAVWFAVDVGGPVTTEELVAEVLAHWNHEPESWAVSDVGISPARLDDVLDGKATIDSAGIGTVSYARSCWVAGRWLPHLVVQSERGPVMVLLVPEQQIDRNISLSLPEQGLGGNLHRVTGGVIAVLGDDGESLAPVERRIVDAVRLRI